MSYRPGSRATSGVPIVLGAALTLLAVSAALANRCGDQNPPRCGLDTQSDPPDPMLGGTGGCTEASLAALHPYGSPGMCRPGETPVIYDLAEPFPDNGHSGDQEFVGAKSFVTIRAGDTSACAQMVDTIDPKPCPDPQLCPDPMSPQPEGAIRVPIAGYVVGCWTAPNNKGCRGLYFYTKSLCLHVQHELLGSGCTTQDGLDCANVSTEQIAVDVPGAAFRNLCGPSDPATSCRGARRNGKPGFQFHFRVGGFCSTNNCANPGAAPDVDPAKTCDVSWGATNLGYDRPSGKGINAPGWYDWKTGAFRLTVTSPKPTCGDLGRCLGERTGKSWDLALVAVPRPGQSVPCIGATGCDAIGCFP